MKKQSKIVKKTHVLSNILTRLTALKITMLILCLFLVLGELAAQNSPPPPPPPNPSGVEVGTLPGNFTVSLMGAATYSLPIKLPEGRAGFTPTLSLNYNSQGGNGLLGVRWTLGGLSAISRTGTNLYNETFIDGVDFDDNDKFMLDGQRLIPIDGSLTEYRTEKETFLKVVVHGSDVHDPDWFEVFAKDGRIIEFGKNVNNNNSQLIPTGKTETLIWQVNRIKDRQGNYIDYYYETGNEAGKISKIKYTGNLKNYSQTFYDIIFEYVGRDDISKQYISGGYVEQKSLLEKINIKYNSETVQTYILNYNRESKFPKMESITTSDNDGASLNPTVFEYGTEQIAFHIGSIHTHSLGKKAEYTMGDFNGDGNTDIVCAYYTIEKGVRNYETWEVFYSNGDGSTFDKHEMGGLSENFLYFVTGDYNGDGMDDLAKIYPDNFKICFSVSDGTCFNCTGYTAYNGGVNNAPTSTKNWWASLSRLFSGTSSATTNISQMPGMQSMDINGNGKSEILIIRNTIGDNWVLLRAFEMDAGGHGTDVFYHKRNGTLHEGYLYQPTSINYPIHAADFTGDGKTNLLVITEPDKSIILEFDKATTTLVEINNNGYNFPTANTGGDLGDFNGDGITDLFKTGSWTVKYFNGKTGWVTGSSIPKPTTQEHYYTYRDFELAFSDYNGDGKTDVLNIYQEYYFDPHDTIGEEFVQSHWDVHYSNGTTFKTEKHVSDVLTEGYRRGSQYLDFNGDGKSECLIKKNDDFVMGMRAMFFHKDEHTYNIKKITNGLGAETKITYESISNSDCYIKQNTANYPVIDLQYPLLVVTKSEKDNGIGGFFEQTYMYEGLKAHLLGIGNLGFQKLSTTNKRANTHTITKFSIKNNNGLYYYKYPSSIVKHPLQANGEVNVTEKIMETTNHLAVKNTISGNQWIYYPVVTENKQKLWDNEAQNTFVKMVTTTQPISEIDNWGNSKGSSVIVSKNESGSMYARTTYESRFTRNMDETKWIIGRPDYTKVTNVYTNDSEESTLRTDYTYYSFGEEEWPLVNTKKLTPNNDPLYANETLFEYNIYGNITKTTTSARDLSIENNPPLISRETIYEYSKNNNYNGRFLTAVTQNDGTTTYTSTNDYNIYDGTMSKSTDAAGLVIEYDYGSFGRLENTSYPDRTWETTFIVWTNWGIFPLEPSEEAVYASVTLKSDGSKLISFKDKLGRKLKTMVTGLNHEWIASDKLYDERGFFHKASEPYFAGNTPDENDTEQWTTLMRNPLNNKTVSVVSPVNTIKMTYSGLETTITNMGTGVSKTTTVDPLARAKSVTDPTGTISYEYYSNGNLKSTDALGSITEMFYDAAGRQTQLDEPNSGTTLYTYSNFGELLTQTDNKGNKYIMSYDKLGRLRRKTLDDTEEVTIYNYYHTPSENGFGMLESIKKLKGIQYSYTYDNLNRLETETEKIDDVKYTSKYAYNKLGQLDNFTYPSGYSVSYQYTPLTGALHQVIDGEDGKTVLWQADAINRRRQLTDYTLGNGLTTQNNYDDISGLLKSIVTGAVQNLQYEFEPATGNLNWRMDRLIEKTENFGYDNKLHNSLLSWQVTGERQYLSSILNNGNINFKSDVTSFCKGDGSREIEGEYIYGDAAGPHAVTGIRNATSSYSLSSQAPQNITYTAFNKVETMVQIITSNGAHGIEETRYGLNIVYGPDNLRKKVRYTKDRGILKYKYYIGTNFEIEVDNHGNKRKLHYISAGDGIFAIYEWEEKISGIYKTMYYIHKDYLGSFETITDNNGQIVEKLSFDPWGRRRNPTDWTFNNVPETYLFDRGFTGHEHLDNFDLINMNGRVYDPWLGRMLSPDPIVQAPGNSQSYNRYSYAFNNPLKYTDPSGYYSFLTQLQLQYDYEGGSFYYRGQSYSYNSETGIFINSEGQVANSGGYYYDWQTGEYKNGYGQVTPYFIVHNNYIVPNSTSYKVVTDVCFNSCVFDGKKYVLFRGFFFSDGTRWSTEDGSLIDFLGDQGSAGGGDMADDGITMQEAGVGMTAFGLGFTAKSNLYRALEGSKNAPKYFKSASKFGTRLSYLGLGMTAYDGLSNGWQNSHSADMLIQSTLITISAINPVVGGVVAGVYFIGDLGFQHFHNGQSMTQFYLDN